MINIQLNGGYIQQGSILRSPGRLMRVRWLDDETNWYSPTITVEAVGKSMQRGDSIVVYDSWWARLLGAALFCVIRFNDRCWRVLGVTI